MLDSQLPELIELTKFQGDWAPYLEAIYQLYLNKIADSNFTYLGLPVKCQRRPMYENKGAGFWHAISEGTNEENRTVDLRRCERIPWIPWIIKHAKNGINSTVTWWQNQRFGNIHIVFLHEKESYVVVLAKRNGYYLLKTAYCANKRRLQELIRERNNFWVTKKD